MFSSGAQLFVLAVLTLAAWLVAHVALVVRVVRADQLPTRDRWLALFPLATPVLAWRTGKHKHVIAWACLLVLYVVVRLALRAMI